jgi:hypothetical protein
MEIGWDWDVVYFHRRCLTARAPCSCAGMLLTFVQTVIDVCVCSLHCCEYQSYLSVSVFGFCLRVRFRLANKQVEQLFFEKLWKHMYRL